MNLDELQSVQARERQSSDLKHLRASFYREVAELLRELTDERAAAVDATADPFSSPEVRRLSDDIETAERTVEAIYERRVGKVVKKASIAAAGMAVDDDGLTDEEAALFDDLVARIEQNRERVLTSLDGDATVDIASAGSPDVDATAPSEDADGVGAADVMGDQDAQEPSDTVESGGPMEADPGVSDPPEPPESEPTDADEPGRDTRRDAETAPDSAGERTEADPEDERSASPGTADAPAHDDDPDDAGVAPTDTDVGEDETGEIPGVPRTTVRITADVGEVVGADDRDYDLSPEDVVTLPEPNAAVLLENDVAERLE
jgi:DNA replication factor GINS